MNELRGRCQQAEPARGNRTWKKRENQGGRKGERSGYLPQVCSPSFLPSLPSSLYRRRLLFGEEEEGSILHSPKKREGGGGFDYRFDATGSKWEERESPTSTHVIWRKEGVCVGNIEHMHMCIHKSEIVGAQASRQT